MRLIPAIGAGLALALAAGTAAAQDTGCTKPAFLFCSGCATPIPVAAKPGGTCVFNFNASGVLLGFSLKRRPQQGRWGQAGPNRFAYQLRPNASGSDYFEVEVRYENRGRPTSTTLQVSVSIGR